jgi:Ca2+-transporting ATPase
MRTIREVTQLLPTFPDGGLTPDGVGASAARFGTNRLTPLPREPAWRKFLAKFDEPIIKILLAAALLSMLVELFQADSLLGGIGLALIAVAVAAALLLRQAEWIPSLLFVSAVVLFLVGLATQHVLVDGVAVMVAVILASGVAFASEYKSDREFEVLNAQKESLRAKVLRDGSLATLPLEEVVVGDVAALETGDEIPADGRLLRATEMRVDQSLMTGESEAVRKQPGQADDSGEGPDKPDCLYRGTQVVDGFGRMLITEVGDATALGQIAARLGAEEEPAGAIGAEARRVRSKLTISKELTPLQQKLERLAALISRVGYAAAVLIFLAQLLHGTLTGRVFLPDDADSAVRVFGAILGYFVNMVIIIVVAVPEGLPMSVTVSLALAMQKMTRANSLVRQLVACETIGSATVICTDKTGTLTQNKMQVVLLAAAGTATERGTQEWDRLPSDEPWPRKNHGSAWLLLNAAVNSTANLEERQGKEVVVGNSTEGALLHWLRESRVAYPELRVQFAPLVQFPFSSEHKRMTTVARYGDEVVALVKGSPEWLLEHSTQYRGADGGMLVMTPESKRAVEGALQQAAGRAMRTLAFGHAVLPAEAAADPAALGGRREELERGLVFDGFVAIRDPVRPEVKAALAHCRTAGIGVKMVTGDNADTARAIALELGLVESGDGQVNTGDGQLMTSEYFNSLDDARLKEQLPSLRVLARARPLDKYRLVKALQELGEVVAVTGDGTNDAPALKRADVGLAMGIAGTEVAKEASKIVLLDDSFATIVKAVHWGRSLYENIQRFLQFQLTINVSALTVYLLGALLFGVEAPFTVLQLLWINVIMDTFASIALCSEPPRAAVMKVPPKRRDESIVTPVMLGTIFVTAAFFVVVMLGLLVAMKGDPESPGWLATPEGPWSTEVAGTRLAVERGDLGRHTDPRHAETHWHIQESPADPALAAVAGRDAEVAFTVLQVSVFFSAYVFFQVWNLVNCRSLAPDTSGLRGLGRNPAFLAIAAAIAVGQIIIVTVGGPIFKVQPLSPVRWLAVIVGTGSVLLFGEAARQIRLALRKT